MTRDALLATHAHCAPCLHDHPSGTCYIYEEPATKRCHVRAVGDEQEADFVVTATSGAMCRVVAVDNCVLLKGGQKKCDCLVFTEAIACFVEIKRGTGRTQLGRDLSKGVKQVTSTIKRFETDKLLAAGDSVLAVVSTKRAEFLRPQLSAFKQTALIGLKEQYPNLNLDLQFVDEVTV